MDDLDIHGERELNKIGLKTYSLDKRNMIDMAIDKLIDDLNVEVTKSKKQFEAINRLQSNDLKS